MGAVLRIDNLTKDYRQGFFGRRVRALDHLSLEVNPGEVFGFLGPNGAGKTTTIKTLLDLIHPTEGTAWLLDQKIGSPELKHRIGYMPENPYFYRFLTAWEFLLFYGRIAGLSAEARRKRAEELLGMVGLNEARNKRIGEFSKGMVQRIGLAQAMLTDPQLILMDEPLSGLDPIGRHEMRQIIERFRKEGKTIFFCSHVLSDVEILCDRVAILNKGKMIRIGSITDIVGNQAKVIEVALTGWDEARAAQIRSLAAEVAQRGELLLVRCPNEAGVEQVLQIALRERLHVHSVTPLRQGLEDYFMKEIASQSRLAQEGSAS